MYELKKKAQENNEKLVQLEREAIAIMNEISQKGPELYDDIYYSQRGLLCWLEREVPVPITGPVELSLNVDHSVVKVFSHIEDGKTIMTLFFKGRIAFRFINQFHKNLKSIIDYLCGQVMHSQAYINAKGKWVPAEELVPDFSLTIYCPNNRQKVGKSPSSFILSDLRYLDRVFRRTDNMEIIIEAKDEGGTVLLKATERNLEETVILTDEDRFIIREMIEKAEWTEGEFVSVCALIPDNDGIQNFSKKISLYFFEQNKMAFVNKVEYMTTCGLKIYWKVSVYPNQEIMEPAF